MRISGNAPLPTVLPDRNLVASALNSAVGSAPALLAFGDPPPCRLQPANVDKAWTGFRAGWKQGMIYHFVVVNWHAGFLNHALKNRNLTNGHNSVRVKMEGPPKK